MGIIRTFAQVQGALGKAILIPQPTGGITAADVALHTFVFQYFPESLTDSQAANYESVNIPGGSHPLQQWVSGGARTISFDAQFASERIVPPGVADLDNPHNVDINGAIWALKFFLYPKYDATKFLKVLPPPRLWLSMPGTFLAAPIPTVAVILRDIRVDIRAWHGPAIPKFANVSLTFEETVQSLGGPKFVDRSNFLIPSLTYLTGNAKSAARVVTPGL